MKAGATPRASPNKNKGGRPKKNANRGGRPGKSATQWKTITNPAGSQNEYEVSNQGEVRRKLKSGQYRMLKPWTTGGPYAAVFLYGFPNRTRHRQKCYIHRLVAHHFVSGRKKNDVVHHKISPANNTAAQLEWVTVEENAKAKKFLDPATAKPRKRTKAPKLKQKPTPQVSKSGENKGEKAPRDEDKYKPVKLPGKYEKLPSKNEYIPGVETDSLKIKWLVKNSREVRAAYLLTRKTVPKLNSKNIGKLLQKATGKGLRFGDDRGADQWRSKLLSALYSIRTRLKQ